MVKFSGSELFTVAARELIRIRFPDRKSYQLLSSKMGVRTSYLTDLIKGRRNWSDKLRDKFVNAIGLSIADMYTMGEEFSTSKCIFPYYRQVSDTAPHSIERAVLIFRLVIKEFYLVPIGFISTQTFQAWMPPQLKAYLNNETSDGTFYKFARNLISHMLEFYISKGKDNL